MITFYLDESGHSGDVVNHGERYDFKGQPFFVLAAVGIENAGGQARHARRRCATGVQSSTPTPITIRTA